MDDGLSLTESKSVLCVIASTKDALVVEPDSRSKELLNARRREREKDRRCRGVTVVIIVNKEGWAQDWSLTEMEST